MNTANLLSAIGWFAGLLVIMIFITALFGFILVIAIKPINKDKGSNDPAEARKLLGKRETELTIELMNKQNDSKKQEELIGQLRQVRSAEELVDELIKEEKDAEEEEAPAKPAKQVKKSAPAGAKPAKKPAPAAEVKPAKEAKPVKEAATQKEEGEKADKTAEPAASAQPAEKPAKAKAKPDKK